MTPRVEGWYHSSYLRGSGCLWLLKISPLAPLNLIFPAEIYIGGRGKIEQFNLFENLQSCALIDLDVSRYLLRSICQSSVSLITWVTTILSSNDGILIVRFIKFDKKVKRYNDRWNRMNGTFTKFESSSMDSKWLIIKSNFHFNVKISTL